MQANTITNHLTALYGMDAGLQAAILVQEILKEVQPGIPLPDQTVLGGHLSEREAILITYADQVHEPGIPPLQSLAEFCQAHLQDVVTGIHVLPFFPSSSDDGFSVIDYRQVDPALGTWEDISRLGRHFALMLDAVINHLSVQSSFFQGFLDGDPRYQHYFIPVDGTADLSSVVRPRALPLVTVFPTAAGPKAVWTTFSADQVDLNYGSPAVLVEIIHTLLFYVKQGAEIIRLDAVAYLWKQLGTPCIHLPETHRIIQLLRAVLDRVAPHVFLITETNVPHRENITYFGNGENEAQLVYNFTLPPLVLHTFLTGDAGPLSRWAATLDTPSDRTTFFNFLASHDGIGVNPVRDILPAQEIERLVDAVLAHGGRISYKDNPDGTQSPYELNIGYFDALSDPASPEPLARQVERFLAAHAILCALKGVPGIYFHSLFGSRSWPEGAEQTGHNRTINRQKFNRSDLEGELALPQGIRPKVFHGLRHLLRVRMSHPAFHPHGSQVILDPQPGIFICWRVSPDRTDRVLCVQNVRDRKQVFHLPDILLTPLDLLCQKEVNPGPTRVIDLEPYQSIWLASG